MSKRNRLTLKQKLTLLFLAPWAVVISGWWLFTGEEREQVRQQKEENKKVSQVSEIRDHLAKELGPYFLHQQFPTETELNWEGETRKVKIDYSIDQTLQVEAEKLLKSYKPDYAAIVVMDALSGRVRAMASFQKGDASAPHLALRGTFPAASIFKVVTAAAAVDKYHLSPDTVVSFNGSNYTLYKRNVLETKVNRWTREMSIREAFARSINTVFGRLTLEKMHPEDLEEYAVRFGFNQKIASDLPFDAGFTEIPTGDAKENAYHLAELASGFNKVTTMSPLQGAMIAGAIAAGGKMMVPSIIDRIQDEQDQTLYQSAPVSAGVAMTAAGAERLKVMMESTITQGTSRKAFRPLTRDRKFHELELGGKTGSLTGTNPRGKVDWFVGYAIGGPDERLAIAAITVNVDKWQVKSAHLAQSMFRRHFKEQFSPRNEKFFNAAQRE